MEKSGTDHRHRCRAIRSRQPGTSTARPIIANRSSLIGRPTRTMSGDLLFVNRLCHRAIIVAETIQEGKGFPVLQRKTHIMTALSRRNAFWRSERMRGVPARVTVRNRYTTAPPVWTAPTHHRGSPLSSCSSHTACPFRGWKTRCDRWKRTCSTCFIKWLGHSFAMEAIRHGPMRNPRRRFDFDAGAGFGVGRAIEADALVHLAYRAATR